jgi:hypothetical protein
VIMEVTSRSCHTMGVYQFNREDKDALRLWLLLEFVGGTELRSCEFDHWVRAASWLGRMQGCFAQRASHLKASDFLVRHDVAFFWSKADLALHAVR